MDDLLIKYRDLARLLEEEYDAIGTALGGELLQKYRTALKDEIEEVYRHMYLFYKI